ncbi:hypothetical protein TESG_08580 [Trichophyton tonsurans CBS 112818]|uniref:Uncharacterized protein n=1 Tax=Trichophyton tonsurans (strain CBS 112818) TaxID=647933 RepID=F2S695_TRIT1|nr:hypothetical protein TESG_08580 [Trichophyton tonsurans CBS 112818]
MTLEMGSRVGARGSPIATCGRLPTRARARQKDLRVVITVPNRIPEEADDDEDDNDVTTKKKKKKMMMMTITMMTTKKKKKKMMMMMKSKSKSKLRLKEEAGEGRQKA